MRVGRNPISRDSAFLQELASALEQLEHRGSTQVEIERDTGVDQTTISRARAGQLKRVTKPLKRLKQYVDMRLRDTRVSTAVSNAAKGFYAAGGSEGDLLASINLATRLVTVRPKGNGH